MFNITWMNFLTLFLRMIRVIDKSMNWNLYWNLVLIRDKKQLTWVSMCFLEFIISSEKWRSGDLLVCFSIYVPTIKTFIYRRLASILSTLDAITTTTILWSTEPVWNKVTKTLTYRSWRRLQEGFEEKVWRGDWCHQLRMCRWPCKVWSNVASRAARSRHTRQQWHAISQQSNCR